MSPPYANILKICFLLLCNFLKHVKEYTHTHILFLIILTLAKKVWEFLNERAKSSALRIHSCRVVMLLQSGGAAHKPPVEYTTGA